ncbi:L-arabinose isomerase [bacterium A37T11]|nr:L-arabinose isomerase [bacterium A37T11]
MVISNSEFTVGLFGIGLEAYWEQFDGLKASLETYLETVAGRLAKSGAGLMNLGLIDSPEKALQAGHTFRQADVDLLFLQVTTYALSATVLPVLQRAKVPVVLLNLSPEAAIDYDHFNQLPNRRAMTGQWLRYCSACPVPEIANVLRRAGIPFYEVTGTLHDEEVWKEISEWVEAARVQRVMAHNRMGLMGHYYSGMLDIYTDLTKQLITFGGHMEMLEVDELTGLRKSVTDHAVKERVNEFLQVFEVQPDCLETELTRAARTSLALDELANRYKLGSMAYYYKGYAQNDHEDTMSSVILGTTLLTAQGIPVAGEYEVKNAQAMKILDVLGAGGSFTEYYAMDYTDDVVLMGHDGPAHFKIGEGKTIVRPLDVYHGKVGRGLAVEMQVKHGPITCLSVVENFGGEVFFLVAEGASVPGPILKIGNTNSRYRFPIGAKAFVHSWNSHGPAHHCAVGVGHLSAVIHKLGHLLGIQTIQVC